MCEMSFSRQRERHRDEGVRAGAGLLEVPESPRVRRGDQAVHLRRAGRRAGRVREEEDRSRDRRR